MDDKKLTFRNSFDALNDALISTPAKTSKTEKVETIYENKLHAKSKPNIETNFRCHGNCPATYRHVEKFVYLWIVKLRRDSKLFVFLLYAKDPIGVF